MLEMEKSTSLLWAPVLYPSVRTSIECTRHLGDTPIIILIICRWRSLTHSLTRAHNSRLIWQLTGKCFNLSHCQPSGRLRNNVDTSKYPTVVVGTCLSCSLMQMEKRGKNNCSTLWWMHCLLRAKGAIALHRNNVNHDGAWHEQQFPTNFQCATGNQIRRASFYVCSKSVSVSTLGPCHPSAIAISIEYSQLRSFRKWFRRKTVRKS